MQKNGNQGSHQTFKLSMLRDEEYEVVTCVCVCVWGGGERVTKNWLKRRKNALM